MAFMTDHTRGFSVIEAVTLWMAAVKERRALRSLGYSRLDDLGIEPKAADREAKRPFWAVRARR